MPRASSSKKRARFHHHQLSSLRSIRLLTLFPSQAFNSDLEASLIEVILDNITPGNHNYEALSYVWGARIGTEPLTCDGKLLLVTPNCESALRHLRQKTDDRVLWVDAICIDQEDGKASTEERNVQVALMGEIYAKASGTLCWFGPGNEYSDTLMRHLQRIGTCPSKRELKKLLLLDEHLREDNYLDDDSSSLDYIFCHPWHSRIWTVQELAYSKVCEVICGNSSIPWDLYSAAAQFLIFEEFIAELDPQSNKSWVSIDMRNTLRNYIRDPESFKREYDEVDDDDRDKVIVFLTSCLTDVIQLQATEPRDKIYGIHSLYTQLGIPLPPINYENSIARVYEEAAVSMIVWSARLKVLADACSNNRDPKFPSWVPDWSTKERGVFEPVADATRGSKIPKPQTNLLSPVPGELHVRGRIVGTVLPWAVSDFDLKSFPTRSAQDQSLILTSNEFEIVEDVETLRLWIYKIRFFRQLCAVFKSNPSYCLGMEPEDVFFDFLRQGSNLEHYELFEIWADILSYPDTKYDLSLGKALVTRWKLDDKANATHWTEELTHSAIVLAASLTGSVRRNGKTLESQAEISDLVNTFATNLANQGIILVQCDALEKTVLGTAFHSVIAGDSLVLLEGADYPVILRQDPARRQDSKWQFCSPSYVTGIMDGEAWSDDTEGHNDLAQFILV